MYRSCKGIKGDVWYFFKSRVRKYPNGSRPNRAAGTGYWKVTGADKHIFNNHGKTIGSGKALVFCEGKSSKDSRSTMSNWIMHEYTVLNQPSRNKRNADDMRLDDWVLCRIYFRTSKSNKNLLECPVDQSPFKVLSEDNTTTVHDNDDNLGISEEHHDIVKQSDDHGLNSNFGGCLPENYQNSLAQEGPHDCGGSSSNQQYCSISIQNALSTNDYNQELWDYLGMDDEVDSRDLDAKHLIELSSIEADLLNEI
ncbi:hypothetical protein BUALT_Bualt01G0059400 [Buddleja alternifolia]|uniref:NAC domain-containing protein n=1 Tax=Buddleja alternifolia TaxID=168488 RepID=A0AAV6Y4W3_9LAMI|nr:hypothetical protein BUALT_Bualt01G0059400 [Buddleja alternifolia]